MLITPHLSTDWMIFTSACGQVEVRRAVCWLALALNGLQNGIIIIDRLLVLGSGRLTNEHEVAGSIPSTFTILNVS